MILKRVGKLLCGLSLVAACAGSTGKQANNTAGSGGGVTTYDASMTSTGGHSGGAAGNITASGGAGGRVGYDAGGAIEGGVPDGEVADGSTPGRDFSTNRALFFGASRCSQAGVQLCEDFESGVINPAIWAVNGTKPVIDSLQKARGAKSLHITVMGNGSSQIREHKTFPAVDNTYYGRMFVYFAALLTPVAGFDYAHWSILAASGTQVSGEIRVSGQMQGGANLFGVGTDNRTDANGTGDWTNSDKDPNGKPRAVPTGEWLCIEWMHKGDKTNETSFWWDAVPHPSLDTVPSTPHGGNPNQPFLLPQFTNLWLGWQEYQTTSETFELWIDEIAIDKDRIGCVL